MDPRPEKKTYPYTVELRAVDDLTGNPGAEQALLTFSGPDYHLRYPVVLWSDQLSERVQLTAVLTGGFVVGPRPIDRVPIRGRTKDGVGIIDHKSSRLAGYRLVKQLYRDNTVITPAFGNHPPLRTLGAETMTLIEEEGRVFLVVGFAVEEGGDSSAYRDPDTADCDLRILKQHLLLPFTCITGAPEGRPVPRYLNMKAWAFDRQGVAPSTTVCYGRLEIVRARGIDNPQPLRERWRSARRLGRAC